MQIIRNVSTVVSVSMPVGEHLSIHRCRYAPEEGGSGRLCIATGIHGDEMMGQLIVYGIASRVLREPESLRGTLDLYPMLNPLGLDIGERMVPSSTRLDMNRAFPGSPDGTALECICDRVLCDMQDADLVLDIHASTSLKSELYEARVHAGYQDLLLEDARDLRPDLIWVLPEKTDSGASLTGALCNAGCRAIVLEVDERRQHPQAVAERVVASIFTKMRRMGLWTGEVPDISAGEPCLCMPQDVLRITCEAPGIFVPHNCIGQWVKSGDVLGEVIDALQGEARELVRAREAGLVFSQRSYSPVYPGTLIARMCRKERP